MGFSCLCSFGVTAMQRTFPLVMPTWIHSCLFQGQTLEAKSLGGEANTGTVFCRNPQALFWPSFSAPPPWVVCELFLHSWLCCRCSPIHPLSPHSLMTGVPSLNWLLIHTFIATGDIDHHFIDGHADFAFLSIGPLHFSLFHSLSGLFIIIM